MKVFAAKKEDMSAWLNLAREVEHLFGPMADDESFQKALLAAVEEGNALCIKDGAGKKRLCGGVVINPETREVVWLAVSEKHRRRGAGCLLLGNAIERLGTAGSISVVTFADSIGEGLAARNLYIKHGFIEQEPVGENPAGFPIVLMVRE
ncbi:MAG: GNAT family N-acetyltransferase [Syntrophomonadaceae bacterium]